MIERSHLPTAVVQLHQQQITHLVSGSGRPLLLLHGWGVDLTAVWPLAQQMVQRGYRVYLPDLPGFGASPAPDTPWTVYDYAKLIGAYLDRLELDRVDLFGHSFGGRLGLILGAQQAHRLHAMALAGAAGLRRPAPLLARVRLTAYKSARDGLKAVGLGKLSDRLRGWYNTRYGSADFNAASGVMRQTFINVVNEDLAPVAAAVQVPTLLIWGEDDADTPLWQGRKLETLIPDAGLVIYPNSGHYAYLEHLTRTADAMNALFTA